MYTIVMTVAVFAAVASILLLLNRMYLAAWIWLFAAVSVADLALNIK